MNMRGGANGYNSGFENNIDGPSNDELKAIRAQDEAMEERHAKAKAATEEKKKKLVQKKDVLQEEEVKVKDVYQRNLVVVN
jgi:hypothetical protein